jgi:ferrochelatase
MKNKKTAVILMNLGGPASLDGVKPFLFNLFYDKAIIRLPNPFRWIIAKLISSRRETTAKKIYSQIGGKSPILEETIKQKTALERRFSDDVKFFVLMRYTSPRSFEITKEISEYSPDKILLLPLYPQFSSTTTDSSIKDITDELEKVGLKQKTRSICCYFTSSKFIESHVNKIKQAIDGLKNKNFRLIFSAHGLPEKVINDGDPYQWQIEETVKNIISNLDLKNLDYKITYQSRVGPMKWLEPYTEEEIENTCKEGKSIIVVPIAFVSEHSETLVELDIEYAEIARQYNIEYFRVGALGTCEIFISALEEIVKKFIQEKNLIVFSEKQARICPENFTNCVCE